MRKLILKKIKLIYYGLKSFWYETIDKLHTILFLLTWKFRILTFISIYQPNYRIISDKLLTGGKFLNISPIMKGLWHLLQGGTTRWLAGATIIAEPGSAIIAEPVLIIRLHPSHHLTGPPLKCAKLQYCLGLYEW